MSKSARTPYKTKKTKAKGHVSSVSSKKPVNTSQASHHQIL